MKNEKTTSAHKLLTVVGTILCIILIPVLIINCILIVKSYTSDEVPDVGGFLPLIVLTDSMYPVIESGDLIICRTAEPEEIRVGDVIAFFDDCAGCCPRYEQSGNRQTSPRTSLQGFRETDGQ